MTAIAYLGQPYWHDDEMVRIRRHGEGAAAHAYLLRHGRAVFAPIQQHYAAVFYLPYELKHDRDFWLSHDKHHFNTCSLLLILPLEGWEESRGLAVEIGWAMAQSKPIFQLTGDIPCIPKGALQPSLRFPQIVCDQYGPRQYPQF